jgi:hypothetical protein
MQYCNRCHNDRKPEDFYCESTDKHFKTCSTCRSRRRNIGKEKRSTAVKRALARGHQICSLCNKEQPAEQFVNPKNGSVYLQCKPCRVKRNEWNDRSRQDGPQSPLRALPKRKFLDDEEILGGNYNSVLLLRVPFNKFKETLSG